MRLPASAVYLLFFLSGAAGLIYEITWSRLLVLIFGTTTNSMVAVICAFLGGLALGNLIFGKIADSLSPKRLIKTYSLLELAVAATAATTLLLLPLTKSIYANFSDGSQVTAGLLITKFILATVILLAPTILMGATLPVLVRFVKNVSLLYGVNTLGAVAGVLLSAFILIELFGLKNTLLAAVGINLLVAIIAQLISAGNDKPPAQKIREVGFGQLFSPRTTLVVVSFAASGLAAIAYEVLWTRVLTPTIGTFIYAFAQVLAIYLVGIGLGSLLYKYFIKIVKSKTLAFAICEIGIGVFALASVILTHKVVIDTPFRIAAVILPATIFMGLTFPVVVSLVGDEKTRGKAVGISYFANTIGSIIGSYAAAFFFIPTFGSSQSIAVLSLVNFTISIIFLLPRDKYNLNLRVTTTLVTVAAIGLATFFLLFKFDRLNQYTNDLKILQAKINKLNFAFKEDEVASVFAYHDPKDNEVGLFIDGVATTSRVSETRLMAHLPIILHGNPQRMLVIAFGMGTTYRSSLKHQIETDAIELVPTVPQMMRFFHPDSNKVLTDENGRVIINDGRNYAFLTSQKYDIVTIDPPPPFNAAGTTVLYSREFYRDLARILNPGGIVGQWIYYYGTREDDGAMAIKSFTDVFPNVAAYQKTGSVGGIFLLGSFSQIKEERISDLLKNDIVQKDLREIVKISPDADLRESIVLEKIGDRGSLLKVVGESPSITDDYPRTEYFLLRQKFTQAPVLVEDNAHTFVEKLKAAYK